ncbi:hypothetical protein [Yimella sp. cx-51]|uniref:hypothetical protein n=1 Tax=Yimella sp. cx-51 TaxID=2770551 RepID=UPI00165D47ED|nr:hypothetical protein [Yimella sp. cx-51]MBC9958016.1 hypothetical protein [Yimella sp. cx-51]QTH38139.1 hypothetical protein J5M86_00035 [Yimella sp. cx-51]
MNRQPKNLAIGGVLAVVTAVAMYFTSGKEGDVWWAYPIMGALLAFILWVMLSAGTWLRKTERGVVDPKAYATAGVIAVVIGAFMGLLTKENTFWSVGFIIAGAIIPAMKGAQAYKAAGRDA